MHFLGEKKSKKVKKKSKKISLNFMVTIYILYIDYYTSFICHVIFWVFGGPKWKNAEIFFIFMKFWEDRFYRSSLPLLFFLSSQPFFHVFLFYGNKKHGMFFTIILSIMIILLFIFEKVTKKKHEKT